MWGHFLFFWPKSHPLTYPLSCPWASRMSFFQCSLASHNSDSRSYSWSCLKDGRFFSSSGFSLVPPALQLILLFFHRWRLSFHTGDRLSGSKSHLSFLAFLKQLLFPALVLKYKRLADDSLTLFRKYLIWGLWKKKKSKKKKEACRESGLRPRSQFLGTSPSFQYSPILPQDQCPRWTLFTYVRCILPRYFSVSVSSAPKVTCLPLLDLLVALQPPNTQGFKKSDELALSWTISISLKAEIFLPLCISQWKPTVLRLPLSLQTCFYSVL